MSVVSTTKVIELDTDLLARLHSAFTTDEEQIFVNSFQLFLEYGPSCKEFLIEFDMAVEFLGFSRKDHAKTVLTKNFQVGIDYQIISPQARNNLKGGRPTQTIMLTIPCFKRLCILSNTTKAKSVHEYYLKMEEVLQAYLLDKLNLQKAVVISTPKSLSSHLYDAVSRGIKGTPISVPSTENLVYLALPDTDLPLSSTYEEVVEAYKDRPKCDGKDLSVSFTSKMGSSEFGVKRLEKDYVNHLPILAIRVERQFLRTFETSWINFLVDSKCQMRREFCDMIKMWAKYDRALNLGEFLKNFTIDLVNDSAINVKKMHRWTTTETLSNVFVRNVSFYESQDSNNDLKVSIDSETLKMLPPPPYEDTPSSIQAIELQKEQEETKRVQEITKQEEERTKQVHETTLQERERTRQLELQIELKKLELGVISKATVEPIKYQAKPIARTFQCLHCPNSYPTHNGLKQHNGKIHAVHAYLCQCSKSFTTEKSLYRHIRQVCRFK